MTEEIAQAETPAPAVAPQELAESAPAVAETNVAPEPAPEPTIPKSRFDEIYGKWREREREAQYWREMANKQPEKPKEEPLNLPTPEQYGFDDAKYQAALVDYNKQIARAEAISAYKAEREQEQQRAKVQSFRQREAEFMAKNPTYRDKVYGGSLPVSQATAELIAESPEGPSIALFLADNLDLATQIYELPPVQAAKEIGRIEARLAQQKEAPPKPVLTKAPPPPPQIEAVEPAVEKDPSKMTDSEFAKWRKRQIAQRR